MLKMDYERKIHYYETDGMGIVHHSNYIRFLEEARISLMDRMGLPYHTLEQQGVMIPVLGVDLEYKYPTKFDDTIIIQAQITHFNGVRMTVSYQITEKETGNLVVSGNTKHCFTDSHLKPISLKKYFPQMYQIFESYTKNTK